MDANYPLIPKEAFLLFPQGQDVLKISENKQNVMSGMKRYIFGNSKYPKYNIVQRQNIQSFKKFLRDKIPANTVAKKNEDTILLKMLYANKFNIQDAYQNYTLFKQWQRRFIPFDKISAQYRQKMDQLLKTGIIYAIPTRDKNFKPIIVVHVGRLLKENPQTQLLLDTFGYFQQNIINDMMIDGQIQTWNVIVNVDQTSVFSFAGVLYDLIKFLSKIFIGRMAGCYIVNHPFIMKLVWKTVSLMMDKDQNQKCKILQPTQILKYLPKQSIQQTYGGILPVLQHFWPLNSVQRVKLHKINQQNLRKIWFSQNNLISENQYYERYLKGNIGNKICTQIINKCLNQTQFNAERQNSVTSSRSFHYKKITNEEGRKLNSVVPKQMFPLCIQIQKQCKTLEHIKGSPLQKNYNNMKSTVLIDTQSTSKNNRNEYSQKQNEEESESQQQKVLRKYHYIYVRKEIFEQVGFKDVFQQF